MPRHDPVTRPPLKSTNGRFEIVIGLLGLAALALGSAGPSHAASVCTGGEPAARAATEAPLSVPPDVRAWARDTVPARGMEIMRLRRLHAAMQAREVAETAADAFAFRFVALAREVGIPAYFVLVDAPRGRSENGASLPVSTHLAAGCGQDGRVVVFDTTAVSRPAHRRLQVLTDRRAVAVVHRDAGVALLRDGEEREAIERLETAVLLAPDMASAWSTLGVALRRAGQQNEALDAYERSIALALSR